MSHRANTVLSRYLQRNSNGNRSPGGSPGLADSLVSRHHPVCGFGKIATFVVLRYATNLWEPVPGREIWGGFSIKNGINREKVVNFRT